MRGKENEEDGKGGGGGKAARNKGQPIRYMDHFRRKRFMTATEGEKRKNRDTRALSVSQGWVATDPSLLPHRKR